MKEVGSLDFVRVQAGPLVEEPGQCRHVSDDVIAEHFGAELRHLRVGDLGFGAGDR